jgi:hypothetical protein
MAQKKEAKKIKVRDLKPKKDAKGGLKRGVYNGPGGGHQGTDTTRQQTGTHINT